MRERRIYSNELELNTEKSIWYNVPRTASRCPNSKLNLACNVFQKTLTYFFKSQYPLLSSPTCVLGSSPQTAWYSVSVYHTLFIPSLYDEGTYQKLNSSCPSRRLKGPGRWSIDNLPLPLRKSSTASFLQCSSRSLSLIGQRCDMIWFRFLKGHPGCCAKNVCREDKHWGGYCGCLVRHDGGSGWGDDGGRGEKERMKVNAWMLASIVGWKVVPFTVRGRPKVEQVWGEAGVAF